MKLAVIEDEQVHRELLRGYLEAWSRDKKIAVQIVSFPSAESFLFAWEEERDFDVLFVDIQMQEMTGMEMAKKIRQEDGDISIVFTTGIPDYLKEGYEVEALHYLLKPISEEELFRCMDRVMKKGVHKQFLLVQTKEEHIKLWTDQILYVEARGHGCVIEFITKEDGTQQVEALESISELEKQLSGEDFIKCHRSYLCRIGAIHRIDRAEIVLDSGSRIPVSRRLYGQVNQAFIRYFRREGKHHEG